ncbi:protein NYNRIN-like [Arachis ipaensis]|uniref:protein NYNRIN-like n=1 Tax=Arachis ipaensis TaxID=130454 RepID=UPI0007AFC604|nr:protein NYNRIN-like [Arachis ipaensis]XP_025664658.1 protein NYNRIN-like [Arachis hypogaea]
MDEYEALILGLEILIGKGALEVQILGDSQLVLKQLLKNEIANELAQITSRYKIGPETLRKLTKICQILVPVDEREALYLDEWEDDDWRKPIAEYLKNPSIQVDRKIKLKVINFVVMTDELYKKGIDGSLSRCLSQADKDIALGEVHRDCIDYAKACQECQRHGVVQQIPASELHTIIKPWPFRDWILDQIGLIHPSSSKNHKFILVAIDYFTKWVEAIPLIEAGQNEIIDFIEEYIIHRFGIPQTLSTDQGTIFTRQRINNFAASRNINMVTSTPYYAQANGQVEAANKILISLIKNRLEAVLPLEINLKTLRILRQDELPVDDYWNAMYDELNDLDSERVSTLENMIRQKKNVVRSYNRRVKEKCFSIGELVLKVVLPMEKKSRFLGKWSPTWEGHFQVIELYSGNAYRIKDIDSGNVINSINGKYLKQYRCMPNQD